MAINRKDIEHLRKTRYRFIDNTVLNPESFWSNYIVGSFGWHEIVDRSYLIYYMWDEIVDHYSTCTDSRAYYLAKKIEGLMIEFYQYVSTKEEPKGEHSND